MPKLIFEPGIYTSSTGDIVVDEHLDVLWISGPHKNIKCLAEKWGGRREDWTKIKRLTPKDLHIEDDF